MSTKSTIAIIGATGRMGSMLAKGLAKGNNRLLLFARNGARLLDLAHAIRNENKTVDLDCVECAADASWEADIIILAVPFSEEHKIAAKIRAVATQKIVVSISNPGHHHAADQSGAEMLQDLLPYSKIVKAFNTIGASELLVSSNVGKAMDSLIAGDDDEANNIIAALVETIGLKPVIVGRLYQSRKLENMGDLDKIIPKNTSHPVGYKNKHH
jgi:predicted dinucleotide-binding enzyme